jgi:hypothetical protein
MGLLADRRCRPVQVVGMMDSEVPQRSIGENHLGVFPGE